MIGTGNSIRGLVVGGHDGSFLILDRVGSVDVVIGVRSHGGEVESVWTPISRSLGVPPGILGEGEEHWGPPIERWVDPVL
jgi:hypothetical protein